MYDFTTWHGFHLVALPFSARRIQLFYSSKPHGETHLSLNIEEGHFTSSDIFATFMNSVFFSALPSFLGA